MRNRVEVAGDDPVWRVTAGSFDSALSYAHERFADPVVLARSDRDRWWPRVTLTVTTDHDLAEHAPSLEDLAAPAAPVQPTAAGPDAEPLPPSLEAIFAHQDERRTRRRAASQQAS